MPVLEERVSTLETAMERFIVNTDRAVAEIRASNARTDSLLLKMQQQADRDRAQMEKNRAEARERADRDRAQIEKNRVEAGVEADQDRAQMEKNREQADRDRAQMEKNRAEAREQADRDRAQMEKNRAEAREQADRDRAQMEKNRAEAREQADRDRAQMEKNRAEAREQADRERKDFNLRLAGISDRMGTLVEDMVAPNIERIVRQLFPGEEFVASSLRNKRQHPGKRGHNMEVDLLVAGTRHVLVCEAKSKLNKEKTDEFLEHLRQFPEFFPEYAAHTLVPVMASIRIDPRAIAYLNRRKVYGLAFADGTMELVNAGQF